MCTLIFLDLIGGGWQEMCSCAPEMKRKSKKETEGAIESQIPYSLGRCRYIYRYVYKVYMYL